MNSRALFRFAGWLVLVATLFAGACATQPRTDWAKRVGVFTYDEAVKEYGPPDKKEITSDGVTVADWVLQRGTVYSTPSPGWGMGGWRHGPWGWNGANDIHSSPDVCLRLQFGPDSRLQSWKQYAK